MLHVQPPSQNMVRKVLVISSLLGEWDLLLLPTVETRLDLMHLPC